MARSLNRVQLIGNLTRDPELRYTPNGNGVCTFGLATNRSWTTDAGEKREEVDFHKIVSWNKLAEICSQFLGKGRKVYVEGRLSTRNWTGQDGTQKTTTEVVIDDMIILDKQGGTTAQHSGQAEEHTDPDSADSQSTVEHPTSASKAASAKAKESIAKNPSTGSGRSEETPQESKKSDEDVAPDDIPF